MTFVWKKLRPLDVFQVHQPSEITFSQFKLLGQLYQPIMGATAYALYLTLICEVDADHHYSQQKNHQWLMNVMDLSLDLFYSARIRLEAMGLLKTYRSTHEEGSIFIYEINRPLSAERFFGDDVLSICLYNQIGAQRYKELRARYASFQAGPDDINREELTKEFHQVFTSLHPSELMIRQGSEKEEELRALEQEFPFPTRLHAEQADNNELQFDAYTLDLEELSSLFMKGINAEAILTPLHIREIKKVAFFYQIDTWNLSRLIQDSLTLDDELEISMLREKAKEWYRLQQGGKPPQVKHLQPSTHLRTPEVEKKFLTEEDRHLYLLETISPIQLLEEYQGGGKIAEADLKIVEELLFDFQLPSGVANVLLEYVLLTNELKLPRSLVTKIAAHWKRAQLKGSKEAQELAKREHKQYKEWQNQNKKQPQHYPRRASGAKSTQVAKRIDILPTWISEQNKSEQNKAEDKQTEETNALTDQQKRKRMEELLKALGEWEE